MNNIPTPAISWRTFLRSTAAVAGTLALVAFSQAADPEVPDAERLKVEAALPSQAFAKPLKARKLLIFDLNVNYGGHASIRTANLAFTLMGKKTGAFETVVSHDPEVFRPESLRQFDAVFFNNTVGNCFTNAELRQSLVEFVYGGGGLMGVHGTTVGFTQWPGATEDWREFGLMIGARGANHRTNNEHVFIKLDDAAHPLNAPFAGQGFDYRSEFFRVHDPYSRNRLRVLFSIDTEKTDLTEGVPGRKLERADGDFALAWVRNYGRGRTFYCTIAHQPSVFWDAKMLEFYLAAAQFILGDLPAPTTPSGRLTPALAAQEKLGWRLGLDYMCNLDSLFALIDRAVPLGMLYLGACDVQRISGDLRKSFGLLLSEDELREVRFKLDSAGTRLLTYRLQQCPTNEANWRATFAFARKMGMEAIIADPPPEALPMLEKLCDEFQVCLALHDNAWAGPLRYGPAEVMKLCQGRSPRLGAAGDLRQWSRVGLPPLEAIRTLQKRLIVFLAHDLDGLSPDARDVPWGAGVARVHDCLQEIHRLKLRPVMFDLSYPPSDKTYTNDLARCVEFFNKASLDLAKGAKP